MPCVIHHNLSHYFYHTGRFSEQGAFLVHCCIFSIQFSAWPWVSRVSIYHWFLVIQHPNPLLTFGETSNAWALLAVRADTSHVVPETLIFWHLEVAVWAWDLALANWTPWPRSLNLQERKQSTWHRHYPQWYLCYQESSIGNQSYQKTMEKLWHLPGCGLCCPFLCVSS